MSMADDRAILLEKVSKVLLGTHDFRALAERSVDLVVKELKTQGLVGAAIFRVHPNENKLYAYAYSTSKLKIINSLLPSKFSSLNVPLAETKNIVVQTVLREQAQQSKTLSDFSRGVLLPVLVDKIQKLVGMKLGISLPIKTRSGRVAGAIMFVLKEEKLSGEQLVMFETFANQLGLAFSNVFAFEKLMHQYQQKLKSETDSDNVPSVKFTLRITPAEDKKLDALARERGKTKAELIRELLDKMSSST